MLRFALLIGIYSYILFFLGIAGWLYDWLVVWLTVGFILLGYKVILLRQRLRRDTVKSSSFAKGFGGTQSNYKAIKRKLEDLKTFDFRQNKLMLIFGSLLALQVGVNFIGVWGPEIGFDALWYHLTLPKLYLINHSIDFIPGGLLYYSAMPKLAEMLYVAGLAFGNENTVKFIHFFFGILTCLATYKLGRKFFGPIISLIAVVIFYSNLVVGWESTSAYIDLVRAFFEVMALWAFVEWAEGGKRKLFILSAIMTGLAIATKLLSIGTLVIFLILFLLRSLLDSRVRGNDKFIGLFVYSFICLLIPLPWFIFSYLHAGNPIYPFFTDIYKVVPEPVSLFGFLKDVWILFTQASDPISYVYVLFAAAISLQVIKSSSHQVNMKVIFLHLKSNILHPLGMIFVYSFLAVVIWYFTPRTGGGRFILPYLPALSIVCAASFEAIQKKQGYLILSRALLIAIIVTSLFSIGYRFTANNKYIPVILGLQTKQDFLSNRLHFDFGDFYDIDGYFASHIKPTDMVLLYGFHNLYYVDFPFVDASFCHSWRQTRNPSLSASRFWIPASARMTRNDSACEKFTYIAVQKGELPEKYKGWKLVYQNNKTMIKLYRR